MKWLWKDRRKLADLRDSMEKIIRLALKLGEDHESRCDRSVMHELISYNSTKGVGGH